MLVIEKYNYSLHNPSWKFTLGRETYEIKDTPQRVEAIKRRPRRRRSLRGRHRGAVSANACRADPPVPRLHQEHLRRHRERHGRRSTRTSSPGRGRGSRTQLDHRSGAASGAPTPSRPS